MKNRTIKFRAWVEEYKQMVQVLNLNLEYTSIKHTRIIYHPRAGLTINVESSELEHVNLMQYTGLKDNNGIEIYEGDILDWYGRKVKVIYGGCAFGFVGLEPFANGRVDFSYDTITNPKMTTLRDAEVIGNIYENKQLLKEDSKEAQTKG